MFHYIFRKQFLLISTNPEKAEAKGLSIRFWDFLFYASFGFVVTSSVAIAGVLLVFCYLVVPSVGAMLFADRIGPRLAIGWTMGTLVSGLGVYFSVLLDTPTGATIVVYIRRRADPNVLRLFDLSRRKGSHAVSGQSLVDASKASPPKASLNQKPARSGKWQEIAQKLTLRLRW